MDLNAALAIVLLAILVCRMLVQMLGGEMTPRRN